jgi:hypothetical protein
MDKNATAMKIQESLRVEEQQKRIVVRAKEVFDRRAKAG